MADIKSLSVRGIRSFGPDENDEQRISFEKPLTLILGQNGCGKTTIIECLRYAITGQMPPGSRNECFVHDAKINRSSEVLAQVKLKIVNGADKQLEVARSMKVTALGKKKTQFKTLDSFLSVIDENGKTTDISSRCADLDVMLHEQLGVPKSILNSVIFCHQEDSSWPLDEGKKVKERFDEIFDADKYSDCFDRLRKLRKDYTQNLKLLELEVQHLTEKKKDLDKKKLESVDLEAKISENELKVAELTSELQPVSEKLKAIDLLQKNLVQWESKREKIKIKLESNQTTEEELKKAIKTIFEGTTEELTAQITNYGSTSKAKQKELDQSYKKNTIFNKEEEQIANEKTNNESKYNKFIFLESQNQERIDKRNKCIVETAKMAELAEVPETIETNEEAVRTIAELTEKVQSLRKDLKDQKDAADAEEKQYQQAVDESRDSLSQHKQKIKSKEVDISNARKEIIKLENQIRDANEAKTRLEMIEQKLKMAEEEYDDADKEVNTEETQQEINDDEKVMEQHEKELDEIGENITKLQRQSAKLKERDLIEEQLKQKEKQYSVLTNKHKVALIEVLGEMPESDFAMLVNKFEVKVKGEIDNMKKKLKVHDRETTKLETERKHIREMLTSKRTELTTAEDQMYKACGTQSYEDTLAKLTATVDKLKNEQNDLESSLHLIAKYKNQLAENSCCPLCSRGFDNQTEVSNLIDQLTTQVLNVPSRLGKVKEEALETSARKDELISLKAVHEKIKTLKETDIPKLEDKLSDVDKKISAVKESVEELQKALVEPEQKMATAKQIHGDMPLLDRFLQEIKTTTRDLESLRSQCEGMDTELTLEDAQAKQKDLKQKISTLKARVKAAQNKLNAHAKKMRQMTDKKNKIKEELLSIQKKVQEIVNLQENKKKIEENRETFVQELKELQDGTAALEAVVKEKEAEKLNVVNKNRSAIELKNSYIQNIVNSFDKVKSIDNEIKQHKEKNIQLQMEKIKEANEKLMVKQKQIMTDRDALTKRIDTLKDELAKQEIYKRDLEDNLKLRKAQAEIEVCQKEDAEINEKLSGVNRESLTEKEALITQQTKLFREKAQTEGELKQLNMTLKVIKNDIQKALNKNIEKSFREKFYELKVTQAMDKDIKDYSVALERCVMKFHSEKMEHINLIIRELWRKIYQGNDIDYIEIKTESSMTADCERRKYDYRVVQCKNGVEIDMRGRCSAGQKVLACLIIRLALAETFSSRFGILALDEPTTNLDDENVRSLCSALGEIVQERMRQKNFMFIIITHDKEFIESLGSIDKVSHYYEVSRNDEGKSRIKKIRFT